MITYTWSFPSLDTKPSVEGLTDVVHVVHWRLRGEDAEGELAQFGRRVVEEQVGEDHAGREGVAKFVADHPHPLQACV